MTIIGMVGAGHMGSGLGWALREGGHDVITSLAGRSARTARLATDAGLRMVPSPADVMAEADVILVVTPPGAAMPAAAELAALASAAELPRARTALPLVVDLNAIAPTTTRAVDEVLRSARLDFVDGSISGPPPTVRPGATIYLSGPRAAEVAALNWRQVELIVVGDQVGAASAVKMCTASVYKGLMGLMTQAMRAASAYGVLEPVMADLGDGFGSVREVALAATKAHRYVPEMREIAQAQAAVGLTAELFEAFAHVWADVANTPLADDEPESVGHDLSAREVVDRLACPAR